MVYFTDEQRMIQETVRKLAREKIDPVAGAADEAGRSSPDVLQVLGGYGIMKDYPLERKLRDAKTIQIFDGTNQIQRVIVARTLFS